MSPDQPKTRGEKWNEDSGQRERPVPTQTWHFNAGQSSVLPEVLLRWKLCSLMLRSLSAWKTVREQRIIRPRDRKQTKLTLLSFYQCGGSDHDFCTHSNVTHRDKRKARHVNNYVAQKSSSSPLRLEQFPNADRRSQVSSSWVTLNSIVGMNQQSDGQSPAAWYNLNVWSCAVKNVQEWRAGTCCYKLQTLQWCIKANKKALLLL